MGKNAWYVAARDIECYPESGLCRWGIVVNLLATHIGIFCFFFAESSKRLLMFAIHEASRSKHRE